MTMIRAALLCYFLIHPLSFAYTFSTSIGASFPNDEVKVHVSTQSCDNINFTNEKILELVAVAVDRFWNTVPTSRLTLERGDLIATSADFKTEPACDSGTNCIPTASLLHTNDIIVACNQNATNFSSDAILALALPNNISGQDIVGGIVLLNDRSTSSALNGISDDEMISTLAHEIGHALGLGHSRFAKNLMHYESRSSRFYLGEDDINGITALYPAEQPFGGCGSIDTKGSHWPSTLTFLVGLLVTCSLLAKQNLKRPA